MIFKNLFLFSVSCRLISVNDEDTFQPDPDRNGDNNSDSGSFHASVWEEERSKRSLVKWAGDQQLDLDKIGSLRRAPTPFPKVGG